MGDCDDGDDVNLIDMSVFFSGLPGPPGPAPDVSLYYQQLAMSQAGAEKGPQYPPEHLHYLQAQVGPVGPRGPPGPPGSSGPQGFQVCQEIVQT